MHKPSSDVRHFECTNSVQYQDLFSTLGDILKVQSNSTRSNTHEFYVNNIKYMEPA
jgi:hypothetical protein